jgi:membrane-anchored glycerophosphoryl diester phosphodiesterase (GDPDase)
VLTAWLVAAVGSFLVALIYYDILQARSRLNRIFTENFSLKQLEKIGLTKNDIAEVRSKTYRGFVRGAEFVVVMVITSFVAATFVSFSMHN